MSKETKERFELAQSANHIVYNSTSGETYHITPHRCPHADCGKIIWICSCPVFTMGRMRQGTDPFNDPCRHIIELRQAAEDNELRDVIQQANGRNGWGLY